jgi:DNA-directed RNA polymerase specialized sigma24 family protein
MVTREQFTKEYERGYLRLVKLLSLRNVTDPEEIAQRAWVKAWVNLEQFEGRNNCSLSTWVAVIAFNEHRLACRRDCKNEPLLVDNRICTVAYDTTIYVEQLLSKIKPTFAKVLRQHYLEGRLLREMKGSSREAISTRLFRARHDVQEIEG